MSEITVKIKTIGAFDIAILNKMCERPEIESYEIILIQGINGKKIENLSKKIKICTNPFKVCYYCQGLDCDYLDDNCYCMFQKKEENKNDKNKTN